MATGKKVLIVEDSDQLRRAYRHALALAGYDVDEARDGYEALRRLDSDSPDIIVLDLGLPGIDGISVLREMAAQAGTRDVPVLIVTGSDTRREDISGARLLKKPVSPERLVHEIRACLARTAPGND